MRILKGSTASSRRARKQPRDDLGRFSAKRNNGKVKKPLMLENQTPSGTKTAAAAKNKVPSFESGGPTGRMQVVKVGKNEYHIPVDKEGYVPHEYLVQRYYDVYKGGKRIRKPMIDSNKNSKVVLKGDRFKPEEVARWVAHPNHCDIKGIDTAGSPGAIYDHDFSRKGDITVANAMPGQKAAVDKQLKDNFTQPELKGLSGKKGYLVVIGKPSTKASGIFIPSRNAAYVDPVFLDRAPDTLVHETIHASRANDKSRKGIVTKGCLKDGAMSMSPEAKTLEEAATHGETIARIRPFKISDSSYYGLLTHKNMDPVKMVEQDRKLFTKNYTKGVKGKAAVNAIEKNFDKSNIANLKLGNSKCTAKEYVTALKNNK